MKHKPHLCAHGSMQKWGIDYWETYAPIVSWITVRSLLAHSHVHSLHSISIDFSLAFPQVTLDTLYIYGFTL